MGVGMFVLTVSCDTLPNDRVKLEAVRSLKLIHTAEIEYKIHHGTYAALPDLGPHGAGLLRDRIGSSRDAECDFQLDRFNTSYKVIVTPRGGHGHWSFFMDDAGIIRYSPGPSLASSSSERIDGLK
jgi:hypothetical protein